MWTSLLVFRRAYYASVSHADDEIGRSSVKFLFLVTIAPVSERNSRLQTQTQQSPQGAGCCRGTPVGRFHHRCLPWRSWLAAGRALRVVQENQFWGFDLLDIHKLPSHNMSTYPCIHVFTTPRRPIPMSISRLQHTLPLSCTCPASQTEAWGAASWWSLLTSFPHW